MKKYKTILADPPWDYNNSGCRGAAKNIYPTMKDTEIYNLPIPQIADKDCVLLLWATWPKLTEAMQVINAWGFEYKTAFPWVKVTDCSKNFWGDWEIKVPYGIGFWIRGVSEPLLISTKGNIKPPDVGFVGLLSPNLSHSKKPIDVYHYAEFLPAPRVELFARRKRNGWDVWGNEVESDIKLDLAI